MMRTAATTLFLALTLTGIDPAHAESAAGPGLGRPATPEQVQTWSTHVMPDGRGLPAGRGDARQGKRVYLEQCQSCHGPRGEGGSADQLAHARMGLSDEWPEKTIGAYWPYATTLFDFNRRSMPMQAPGTLSDDETYAVTAYLLYLNGIIGEREEMNAGSLARVKMPNRDGFIDLYQLNKKSEKP